MQSEKASHGVSVEVVGCRARWRILDRLGGEKFSPSSSSHITSHLVVYLLLHVSFIVVLTLVF
jgi:hypothetical protein